MEQENKKLLLRYLSMALPYYVQVKTDGDNEPYTLLSVHPNKDIALIGIDMDGVYATSKVKIDTIKPYLRPMSSMTEEEKKEYNKTYIAKFIKAGAGYRYDGWWEHYDTIASFDWLNAQHFDYRGLIEKGLAIEVTKENYG